MNDDAGGWLWLIIDVGLVVLFAAGLIYGVSMWRSRRRSPGLEQARDQRTSELYHRSGNE